MNNEKCAICNQGLWDGVMRAPGTVEPWHINRQVFLTSSGKKCHLLCLTVRSISNCIEVEETNQVGPHSTDYKIELNLPVCVYRPIDLKRMLGKMWNVEDHSYYCVLSFPTGDFVNRTLRGEKFHWAEPVKYIKFAIAKLIVHRMHANEQWSKIAYFDHSGELILTNEPFSLNDRTTLNQKLELLREGSIF